MFEVCFEEQKFGGELVFLVSDSGEGRRERILVVWIGTSVKDSVFESSQRLKCGAKEGLCVVEELKMDGSLLEGHPGCLVGLFPLVRVVEAS